MAGGRAPERIEHIGNVATAALKRIPRPGEEEQAPPPPRPSEAVPDWLREAVAVIRTKFAPGSSSEWNAHDTRDYGRQFRALTPKQAGQVVMLLRDRYTFRPSVAEVRAVVEEVTGKPQEAEKVPAHAAQSFRQFRIEPPSVPLLTGEAPKSAAEHIAEIRAGIKRRLREEEDARRAAAAEAERIAAVLAAQQAELAEQEADPAEAARRAVTA